MTLAENPMAETHPVSWAGSEEACSSDSSLEPFDGQKSIPALERSAILEGRIGKWGEQSW